MQVEYLPCLVAIVCAAVVVLLRSHAAAGKFVGSAACIAVFGSTGAWHANPVVFPASIGFLTVVALASVIAQQGTKHASTSVAAIVFVLGLLCVVLSSNIAASLIAQAAVLAVLIAIAVCFRKNSSLAFGAAAAFAIALVSSIASAVVPDPTLAIILRTVAAAALLPLFPLHVGYVGALNNLPGTLPAFLALALPLAGWHALQRIGTMGSAIEHVILVLAVVGALCTSMRAFVQSGLSRIVGAVGTLLFLPAWWLVATVERLGPDGGAYIVAVGLVVSGFMICAHCIESRYGTQVVDSVPGLATTMPKFGVTLSLLVMAGAGLPAFAVFSTFVLSLMSTLRLKAPDMLFVAVVWLVSFAIQVYALQRLLFSEPRSKLVYKDLSVSEAMSLIVIIALLIFGGLWPGIMIGSAG